MLIVPKADQTLQTGYPNTSLTPTIYKMPDWVLIADFADIMGIQLEVQWFICFKASTLDINFVCCSFNSAIAIDLYVMIIVKDTNELM